MLTPIGKRIIIKAIETKQGNLIVTNVEPILFNVVAVGDEVTKIKAGDTIYLEKHYGTEIKLGTERFLVVDQSHVLAKLE